jgi:protein transport protein SEC24
MAQFHGNFFVRSTDLLAFPAIPIDQSYAVEVQIEENLTTPFVVMQTGILYTTSFGEFICALYHLFPNCFPKN